MLFIVMFMIIMAVTTIIIIITGRSTADVTALAAVRVVESDRAEQQCIIFIINMPVVTIIVIIITGRPPAGIAVSHQMEQNDSPVPLRLCV